MGERWVKEAEQLRGGGSSGAMSRNHNNPKVTWHVTVSGSGSAAFDACHRYLGQVRSEPHFLYDPLSDRLGQWFPLDRSSRALRNDGSTPTNRDGTINIQIEVVAQPDGFTRYWKPGPNFAAMMRAIRSWGVPDTWPAGGLSQRGENVSRSWSAYRRAGHFGHCNVPGNDHWDPGPISRSALLNAAPGGSNAGSSAPASSKPKPEKYWTPTAKGYTTKDVQRIVGVTVDNLYGPATKAEVRKLQKRLGVTADGYFGPTTASAFEKSRKKSGKGKGGKKAPKFPLPKGHWYGVESSNPKNHSGYYRKDRRGIKKWQRRMKKRGWRIKVDGRFGPQSRSVALGIQRQVGIKADGAVGIRTWKKSWSEPVT